MYSFIETKLFSQLVAEYLSDEEYSKLQQILIEKPEAGDLIPGSGGVRKLRGKGSGRGKRGGVRVIYYTRSRQARSGCLLFTRKTSPKISRPIFWKRQRKKSMPRGKRQIGLEILEGIRRIKRGEHGRVINVPSVSAIRESTGLSQKQFAQLLGVSVRTLQEWEQGRRAPSGAARTLLRIAAKNPRAVLDVAWARPPPIARALPEREIDELDFSWAGGQIRCCLLEEVYQNSSCGNVGLQ
jgi:putative transcriptional regulator